MQMPLLNNKKAEEQEAPVAEARSAIWLYSSLPSKIDTV
jgi:hypothetical protein